MAAKIMASFSCGVAIERQPFTGAVPDRAHREIRLAWLGVDSTDRG